MTTAVLDEDLMLREPVASGHGDRQRVLRDRGHQLRAARRRWTLSRLKHASARSGCREHGRRAFGGVSSQVTSGVYDDSVGGDGGVVCLANGTRKAISEVAVGDEVLATDPETGETSSRTVTATHVMLHDGDLLDLTIEDDDGEGIIQTSDQHKFWSVTDGDWEAAIDLSVGEQLRQADGTTVTVMKVDERPGRQDMHDLTVEVDHTFYVDFGAGEALVHNVGCDDWAEAFIKARGGTPHTFKPPAGRVFPEGTYAHQPAGEAWFHHTVAVKNGKVFDQFNPNGISIADYKALWGDMADEINFGF